MSNIVTFSGAKLPAVTSSLSVALRAAASESSKGGDGSVILKMDKTGHWVFGADQTEVESESTWAVNPLSFVHGYIAWGEGEVLGEKMVGIDSPLPELDAAPPGAKRGWEQQIGMSLKCLTGEDAGVEARYTITSVGGKKAVQQLALSLAEQVDKDPTKVVPVVKLQKDHYVHKSYGRIYTPVFSVQTWVSMDGEDTDTPPEAEAEVPAATRRRRA